MIHCHPPDPLTREKQNLLRPLLNRRAWGGKEVRDLCKSPGTYFHFRTRHLVNHSRPTFGKPFSLRFSTSQILFCWTGVPHGGSDSRPECPQIVRRDPLFCPVLLATAECRSQ